MYLDIHAHFAEEGYDEREELKRIACAGVEKIVLASDTVAHSFTHARIAAVNRGVYFTAGVHPSECTAYSQEARQTLFALCAEEKCVAVGEIGLDYHYPDFDKQKQREAFLSQILLAEQARLPVQIHSRDCAEDMLCILREMKAHLRFGFLLHCYSHGAQMMDDFLSLGAYFSFGGVTCFHNAKKVCESVKRCPAERLLSETDSPYLSPFRGEKNTPANIPVIVKRIAQLREEEEERVKNQIAENALRLFPKLGG